MIALYHLIFATEHAKNTLVLVYYVWLVDVPTLCVGTWVQVPVARPSAPIDPRPSPPARAAHGQYNIHEPQIPTLCVERRVVCHGHLAPGANIPRPSTKPASTSGLQEAVLGALLIPRTRYLTVRTKTKL